MLEMHFPTWQMSGAAGAQFEREGESVAEFQVRDKIIGR